MRRRHVVFGLMAILATTACGSEGGTGPSPSYQQIAGSYHGPYGGVASGVLIDTWVSFTLNQAGPNLTGSFAITGTLSDGITTAEIQGTGPMTGTVGTGLNPSVNLRITPSTCPQHPLTLSGTYDSANRRVTLYGTVQFFDAQCDVILQAATTLVITPS